MISYTTFRALLSDVPDCPDFDTYAAECGGAVPLDNANDVIRLLTAIWTMAHNGLTIKSIAQACDISVLSLARDLDISRRTVGDWSTGDRTPPEWQLPLIAYAVLSDHMSI